MAESWLDTLLGRLLKSNGTPVVKRSFFNFRNGFTLTDDPATNTTHIDASGGGGGSGAMVVADQTALRNRDSTTNTDGQQFVVKATNKLWTWSALTGAGFAGDDRSITQPTAILTANAGRYYISDNAPIAPTIAALQAMVSGKHDVVQVQSFSALGDGGGGTFDWIATDTRTADGGVIVQATGITTGRWVRRFHGPAHAAWWGVRGDGKYLTDIGTTASSAVITSASAGFTAGDPTKKITLDAPNALAAGTLSSSGATMNGTATNVGAAMPIAVDEGGGVGKPLSGGWIYCDGQYLVVNFVLTATQQLQLARNPSPAITNKAWYAETQLPTSISGFTNSTTVTLANNASITQSNVKGFYGTDNTTALTNAINGCFTLGIRVLLLPDGWIGVSSGMTFTDKSYLTIRGTGYTRCGLVDFRRASDYDAVTGTTNGIFLFQASNANNPVQGIFLEDFSYDARIPSPKGVHSTTPGNDNGSGGRAGFVFRHTANSGCYRIGSQGYGARDEHIYVEGQSHNFSMVECNIVGNNNVSLNCNGGFDGSGNPQPKGLKITNCHASGILVSAADYEIAGNDLNPGSTDVEGGITVDKIGHGKIRGGIIHNFVIGQGVGLIDCFGNNSTTSSLEIDGVTFAANQGSFYTGRGAAGISLTGFGGQCAIRNCVMAQNISFAGGGRHVYVDGASTGKVTIENCDFGGGTNMSTGVEVTASVPGGAVVYEPSRSRHGTSITTPMVLGTSLGRAPILQIVNATGTTAIDAATESVHVTANGSVTLNLPTASNVPGRKIFIKNGSTQAGTTSVGSVDAGTQSLTGAYAAMAVESINGNWGVVAGSSVVSGFVPTTRTVTGSGAIKVDGDNVAHDLSANRTISIADASTSVKGAIQLGNDLAGTATSQNVVQLTGAGNSVAIPSATTLDWNGSSGPEIGTRDSGLGINIKVRTAGNSIAFMDQGNLIAFLNYNGGNPFLQQNAGAGFTIQATGGDLTLHAQTASQAINFKPGGSSVKMRHTSVGLRIGDGSNATVALDVLGTGLFSTSIQTVEWSGLTGADMFIDCRASQNIQMSIGGTTYLSVLSTGQLEIGAVGTGLGAQPSALRAYSAAGALLWWGSNSGAKSVQWDCQVAATASAGGGQAVPGTVADYMTIFFNGNSRKIPLFST